MCAQAKLAASHSAPFPPRSAPPHLTPLGVNLHGCLALRLEHFHFPEPSSEFAEAADETLLRYLMPPRVCLSPLIQGQPAALVCAPSLRGILASFVPFQGRGELPGPLLFLSMEGTFQKVLDVAVLLFLAAISLFHSFRSRVDAS